MNSTKNFITEDKEDKEAPVTSTPVTSTTVSSTPVISSQDTVINKTEPTLTDKIKTYKTQKMNEPQLEN